MAANPPSDSKPAGDDRNLVAASTTPALSFEDKAHDFWQKNRQLVLGVIIAVVIGIIGKGGWDYFSTQREHGIERDYAAATTPDQLKAFAASHSGHPLAGVAQLRIADDAYAAGKSADALAGYEKALTMLQDKTLAARARLGRAMAKIQGGKTSEGTEELRQLANDASQLKPLRAEAAYQLASIAAEAGNSAEVQKVSDQLMQIDPASPWVSRAMALRASMPVTPTSSATSAASTSGKKEASPAVELKLPGKK